ncbi:hypothetical protein CCP3SC15_850003 [Gammaproteobacteria bacterium]
MIATLADFCEGSGLPATAVPDLCRVLSDRESFRLAEHEARMNGLGSRVPGSERTPILEGNDEVGRVEGRVALTDYFNMGQKYGFDCWQDDEFVADYFKSRTALKVNTVSGRIVSGWQPGRKTIKKY